MADIKERLAQNYYITELPCASFTSDGDTYEAHQDDQRRLEAEFWSDFDEYFGIKDNPKAKLFHEKMWELGHSSGYDEVLNYADDLIDLIK